MKVTNKYEIPAIVIETGEIVKVDNQSPFEPKNGSMWHNTSDGRVFHDDELSFLVEISKAIEWLKGEMLRRQNGKDDSWEAFIPTGTEDGVAWLNEFREAMTN